jgi:hypothetical protein
MIARPLARDPKMKTRNLSRLIDEKPELDGRGRPTRHKLQLYYHEGLDIYSVAAGSDVRHCMTKFGGMMYLKEGVKKGLRMPKGTTEKQARAVFSLMR